MWKCDIIAFDINNELPFRVSSMTESIPKKILFNAISMSMLTFCRKAKIRAEVEAGIGGYIWWLKQALLQLFSTAGDSIIAVWLEFKLKNGLILGFEEFRTGGGVVVLVLLAVVVVVLVVVEVVASVDVVVVVVQSTVVGSRFHFFRLRQKFMKTPNMYI